MRGSSLSPNPIFTRSTGAAGRGHAALFDFQRNSSSPLACCRTGALEKFDEINEFLDKISRDT